MTARFVSGEVLLTTGDIRGVLGHFGASVDAGDPASGQLMTESKRMHLRHFGGVPEGSQFALIERTSQLDAQAFLDITSPTLKGCHYRLGNIKRYTHVRQATPGETPLQGAIAAILILFSHSMGFMVLASLVICLITILGSWVIGNGEWILVLSGGIWVVRALLGRLG